MQQSGLCGQQLEHVRRLAAKADTRSTPVNVKVKLETSI